MAADLSSPEALSDPCCNTEYEKDVKLCHYNIIFRAQVHSCCAARNISVPKVSYLPNDAATQTMCTSQCIEVRQLMVLYLRLTRISPYCPVTA